MLMYNHTRLLPRVFLLDIWISTTFAGKWLIRQESLIIPLKIGIQSRCKQSLPLLTFELQYCSWWISPPVVDTQSSSRFFRSRTFLLLFQVSLFNSIKPLFANKPTVVVLNKIDTTKYENLDQEDRSLLEGLTSGHELPGGQLPMLQMSTLADIGIAEVKKSVCTFLHLVFQFCSRFAICYLLKEQNQNLQPKESLLLFLIDSTLHNQKREIAKSSYCTNLIFT